MKKVFSYLATAIVPVFLTWMLGYVKAPDEVTLLDYSSGGSELISSKEDLATTLKTQAGGKPVEKLSIYYVHFMNKSDKNLQKTQVEFKVKGTKSELLASAIKGPKGYSESLIKKISESPTGAIYSMDFINVASKDANNYFTASFLFSGEQPESIEPVPLTPSVGFIDARENNKAAVIGSTVLVLILSLYIVFLIWYDKRSSQRIALKDKRFEDDLVAYLDNKFTLGVDESQKVFKEVLQLRKSIYHPESKFKTWLRNFLAT